MFFPNLCSSGWLGSSPLGQNCLHSWWLNLNLRKPQSSPRPCQRSTRENQSGFLHQEIQRLAANSNGPYPLTTPITFKHDDAGAVGMFFSQLPPKRWPMSLRREQTMARLNDKTHTAKKHLYIAKLHRLYSSNQTICYPSKHCAVCDVTRGPQ